MLIQPWTPIPPMLMTTRGRLQTTATLKRFAMSFSSGFSVDKIGCIGSSAIPQIGQEPKSSLIISGCIGHVYWSGTCPDTDLRLLEADPISPGANPILIAPEAPDGARMPEVVPVPPLPPQQA